jgi:tRNA/rRNA methyltransferase
MLSAPPPVFILVNPQMGENIGAAARAMMNFGIPTLRLVNPRDGWPNPAATDNATGAFEHMNEVVVFPSLKDAIADLHTVYATTARTRDIAKATYTPAAAMTELRARHGTNNTHHTGFVFGPERTGLENDDLALCHAIVYIPTNPAFPVLNLAQSVLLIAQEFFRSLDQTPPVINDVTPAPQAEFDALFQRLQDELDHGGFFKSEDLKPRMLRNLRTMLLRGQWSEQEIRTFQGMLSALTGKNK